MRNVFVAFVLVMVVVSSAAMANPTGAPLVTFPVEPCRVLDTRVSLGPLLGGNAMDVFVRGSALDPNHGANQIDCGIPFGAEAVLVNVVAVNATGVGALKINGTGFVHGPQGNYSRINYRPAQNDANELVVSLCNVFFYPAPQTPCGLFEGVANDFQILNTSSISSLDIVADVVGYMARSEEAKAKEETDPDKWEIAVVAE